MFRNRYCNMCKEKIDKIHEDNARVQANLGTKSKHDVGSKKAAEEFWEECLKEIEKIDPKLHKFYMDCKD